MGGSLLHGLPLVGLGPWGRWAMGFVIINKIKKNLFFCLLKTFLKECIFQKGCKLSERLHTNI